jgi:hypothetical protein
MKRLKKPRRPMSILILFFDRAADLPKVLAKGVSGIGGSFL